MELRHLRAFVAVAQERSFTRAAERLTMAQSPLSQQIRQLERLLRVRLFERTTRSVALTPAGEVFLEHALRILAATDDAADAARQAALGRTGRLAVGFTGSATFELLPTLVRAFADRYPDVTLDVRSDMVTPRQVEALLAGRLGVGVLRPPVDAPGLVVEVIRREPVLAVLSSRHPRSADAEIDLADLRDDWFVAYPADPPSTMYGVMRAACTAAGFVPRVRQVAPDSASLVALVAADRGVALVPASLRHLGVVGATFRPLHTPRPTVELALAHAAADAGPLVRNFLDTARAVVAAWPSA